MPQDEMGEARMDVIDTEMGYLGYHESESYGLVWKVRVFCFDTCTHRTFSRLFRDTCRVLLSDEAHAER